MHITELQRLVVRISNNRYVRWWAHWNYPCQEPFLMAISLSDGYGNPIQFEGELPPFHSKETHGNLNYYFFERTDDNGNPYKTTLY